MVQYVCQVCGDGAEWVAGCPSPETLPCECGLRMVQRSAAQADAAYIAAAQRDVAAAIEAVEQAALDRRLAELAEDRLDKYAARSRADARIARMKRRAERMTFVSR